MSHLPGSPVPAQMLEMVPQEKSLWKSSRAPLSSAVSQQPLAVFLGDLSQPGIATSAQPPVPISNR